MGTSYISNQPTGWLSSLHQSLDIARVRGPHLHNGNVVLVVQSEQSLGNTHIVVEVTFRRHHVIAFREYGTNQLLGGCLSVGTCNADNRNLKLTTMLARQVFEGLQAVVNENDAIVLFIFRVIDDGIGTSFLKC